MPPVVPLLQPGQPPGSAGNNARDTDIPRRLRIRARQCWNPSVTDVIVNTRPDVGGLGRRNSPRVHDALETAFTISGLSTWHDTDGGVGEKRGCGRQLCHVRLADVYVASSAVFPTVSHANPTLTIVALSLPGGALAREVEWPATIRTAGQLNAKTPQLPGSCGMSMRT
jgi:hypothetical protein